MNRDICRDRTCVIRGNCAVIGRTDNDWVCSVTGKDIDELKECPEGFKLE